MPNEHFLPPIEPFATGDLAVEEPHVLYWEQVGNPDGVPVLFVHGGPGAGCTETDRRFFDPSYFRVVLFDQRGAGRSRPTGETAGNSIEALVADIEVLRRHLDIDRWHVFGGSWGSTLSLAYAQTHPAAVKSLILRGIWLLRPEEIHWWLYSIRFVQPELWEAFVAPIAESERHDLLTAYRQLLASPDRQVALAAARAWSTYEGSCCTLLPDPEFAGLFDDETTAWAMAVLEAHYFANCRFSPEDTLLRDIHKIRHIPTFVVHGRYDIVCPVKNAYDLQQAWPEASVVIVPDAGHSSHEPGITQQLIGAMERIRDHGSPVLADS